MDVEKIAAVFAHRLDIYRRKRAAADPFANETYTLHDALNYVVEAIELLGSELGIRTHLENTNHD